MFGFRSREIHSEDEQTYIEGMRGEWIVVFESVRVPGTFTTREAARRCIREMKSTKQSHALLGAVA